MKKEGLMLTDVDVLLHLLEKRKRISMEQAAKELKTSIATIENWTSVLEEDGLVTTKYSLTTPFIEFKQTTDAKHNGLLAKKDKAFDFSKESKEKMKSEQSAEHLEINPIQSDVHEVVSIEEGNMKSLISQAKSLIKQGNFDQAIDVYGKIKRAYDSLPVVFLQRKSSIESELVHLNNELSVEYQRNEFERIKQGKIKINDMLKQGKRLIKEKKVDEAIETYNNIKTLYNSLPEGFYGDKTKLAEDVLDFFQNLSQITSALNKQNMSIKTSKILALVNQIEALIARRDVEQAIQTYAELKEIYSTLPPGYLDRKLDLQEKMINIYRQLMVDKKSILRQDVMEKSGMIKQLLQQSYNYMKNQDIDNATKTFNEARRVFDKMPSAFSDEHSNSQALLLKYYRQLIELKKYVSVQSIKQGSSKIHKLVEKAQKAHKAKDFDVAYDLYKEVIHEYNTLPQGFDPGKLELRKQVYQLYYDVISGHDLLELGELNPYIKVRYFKLLDMLVGAHEVIDSNQFSLIDKVYSSIYGMYNELPVFLVNKNFLLKKEVGKIFEIQRLYQAALGLQKYYYSKDIPGLRTALSFINTNFANAEINCYGFVKLLKFVKQEYEKYVVKAYMTQKLPDKIVVMEETMKTQEQLKAILPQRVIEKKNMAAILEEEAERKDIDQMFKLRRSKQLYRAALKNIKEGDYVTASKALERLLKLDPRNRMVEKKLVEVTKLRQGKFKSSMVSRLINAKKNRLRTYVIDKSYDLALEEVYTILELDPEDEEAKLLLDKINFEKGKAKV